MAANGPGGAVGEVGGGGDGRGSAGSVQAADAPVIFSDKFQQPKGLIDGASDSVSPQSGGRSCCAVDSTGAVPVQVQLLDSGRCP